MTYRWVIPDPLDQFQAGTSRHFQVREHNGGKWKRRPIVKTSVAQQVFLCLRAVFDPLEKACGVGALQRSAEEEKVILVVLDQQPDSGFGRTHTTVTHDNQWEDTDKTRLRRKRDLSLQQTVRIVLFTCIASPSTSADLRFTGTASWLPSAS